MECDQDHQRPALGIGQSADAVRPSISRSAHARNVQNAHSVICSPPQRPAERDRGIFRTQGTPCWDLQKVRTDTTPNEMSRLVRDLQLVDARYRKFLAADERRRFLEAAAQAVRPADQTSPSLSLTPTPGPPKPWPFAPETSTSRPPRSGSRP